LAAPPTHLPLIDASAEMSGFDLNPIFALPEGQGCKIVERGYGRVGLPQRTG
jgi:hypothetical protein